jgi:zinc transporter ZupT
MTRTEDRRQRAAAEFALIAVVVYVLAALILSVPAFFLGTGVQAIGALLGWWMADPNANDGEELLGTAIGLVSAIIVLGVAAAVIVEAGRRYLMRPRLPILIGTAAIVVELVAVCVWVVAA